MIRRIYTNHLTLKPNPFLSASGTSDTKFCIFFRLAFNTYLTFTLYFLIFFITYSAKASFNKNTSRWRRRLEPFIKRELQMLRRESFVENEVRNVVDILRRHEVTSPESLEELAFVVPYEETSAFAGELKAFADSGLTMREFDEKADYQ